MGGSLPRVPGGRVAAPVSGLWLLKDQPGPESGRPDLDAKRREGEGDGRRKLLCARCHLVITDDRQRIERNGRHAHVFANPHGIAFEIGCFARAPGSFSVGPREHQFSWFPGYTWQLSACRACHGHLGWRFQAAERYFLGLIFDRLISWHDGG